MQPKFFINKSYIPLINDENRYLVLRGGAGCFTKGTKVFTDFDGNYKEIQDLKVGDVVVSYNHLLQENQLRKVTKVHSKRVKEVIHIPSLGIDCTPEHKFFSEGMYYHADDLFKDEMRWQIGKQKVYDISVECNTNFFIMKMDGDSQLVHNSGKSVFLSQLALIRMIEKPKISILVIRKVGNTLMNSVYKEIKNVAIDAGVFKDFRFTRNPLQIRYGDSEINFSGIDDPEKIKSFSRADIIWAEECTELDYEDFKQLDLRLRGEGHKKQFWLSFNPIDEDHWVRTKLWDSTSKDVQENMTKLLTTYRDNSKLDDAYIKTLLSYKDIDTNYYNIYALGAWGKKPEGLIYNIWHEYTNDTIPDDFEATVYGLDFGYNDPMALIEVKIRDKSLYVREILYRQKMGMGHFIEFLNTMGFSKTVRIYCDHASPEKIKQLQMEGFNAHACIKGDIRAGIDTVKQFSLYIHNESSNLRKELSFYSWQKDRAMTKRAGKDVYSEKPADWMNHAMDAMRYAVVSLINRPIPGIYVFK